jgi:hypothetical protein
MEEDLYVLIEPVIEEAKNFPSTRIVVLLDEVNATIACWTAKDMLCDHICAGVRIPNNVSFVVILNPWKYRSEAQEKAIAEMDVGGLDFMKYQQSSSQAKSRSLTTTSTQMKASSKSHNLVYQVHKVPESLYSLVWDWGIASETNTPLIQLENIIEKKLILLEGRKIISDELLLASNMVSWLISKLSENCNLQKEFQLAHECTKEAYWIEFRSLLVHLLLKSQYFIRTNVYLGEVSSVSLRDMRKCCELVYVIFNDILCLSAKLEAKQGKKVNYFRLLNIAFHCGLINTYCLRLDTVCFFSYLCIYFPRIIYYWKASSFLISIGKTSWLSYYYSLRMVSRS